MSSSSGTAQRRLQAVSQHVAEGIPNAGTFENMPRIQEVGGDSVGLRAKGKVVIVTGVNSPLGIGRASAHQFARNGAKAIFICDFADSHLDTHKRELESLYPGVDILIRQFDAGNEEKVKAVVDDAIRLYGRLDIFFANAGIVGSHELFTDITGDVFMQVMETNAKG
ncbi:hypothetical protein ACJ72_07986 [Emergomyces africanus]|uniref:Uncharacterized protein n=1 Tax=Emergomyces africanus TaxID=1955775 RepID=A0A1B7NLJ6_9EURO|nr:hypothetical protein ACJ72_07986 [Emergomyces africanus]